MLMIILLTDNFIFCIILYQKPLCRFLVTLCFPCNLFLFLYLNSSSFISQTVFNAHLNSSTFRLSHIIYKNTHTNMYYLKKLTTEQIQFKTTQKNNYYGQWRQARVQISQLLPMCCVHGYRASNVLLLLLVDCV